MKHNIGTIEVLNVNDIILLKANSSLRYKGPKYNGLKKSIKSKGVLSPIDVGRLNGKDHAANGNREVSSRKSPRIWWRSRSLKLNLWCD